MITDKPCDTCAWTMRRVNIKRKWCDGCVRTRYKNVKDTGAGYAVKRYYADSFRLLSGGLDGKNESAKAQPPSAVSPLLREKVYVPVDRPNRPRHKYKRPYHHTF